jgi:putative colanic acid biosynthesis acetyltransferase WcaB
MSIIEWTLQDWKVNKGRPDSQSLLAFFRLAQWATARRGPLARLIRTSYWLLSSIVLGIEVPAAASIGPRLRLYHPHGIVLNPHCTIGSDCQLRHNVTVGNRVDRSGQELGVATLGDDVELGTGCVVVGALHVGDHARIGALAVVTKSVPDWAVVVGNPGRVLRIDDPTPPA